MSTGFIVFWRVLALIAGITVLVFLLISLLSVLGKGATVVFGFVARAGRHVARFVSGMCRDVVGLVGSGVTAGVFAPMILGNVAIGRWSRANHYGRAMQREVAGLASGAWRLAVGHPARFLGLGSLIDGVERRIPETIARAPGADSPGGRQGFEGYTVLGSLPSGGSGARLFLAEPDEVKRLQLAKGGRDVPARVVIKSFSLDDGSTMPQIVRESRALEAARSLGLVLEHTLRGTRFHYVMPYVPGEDLGVVTQKLHAAAGAEGLGRPQLAEAMGHVSELLAGLHRFHAAGLWHKDIKPTNIIVSDGRAQLVDLGLITPLASAMTLTTHGTEYFRDPELVRLALRGVKVHEVDGVKFDVYGVGAVLYSLIENGFPAHGSLSQITRRCPEALRWIVRRAMAEMGQRYAGTAEMLADLRVVMAARDPFKVKPAELPSVAGRPGAAAAVESELAAARGQPDAVPSGGAAAPPRVPSVAATSRRGSIAATVLIVGLGAMGLMGWRLLREDVQRSIVRHDGARQALRLVSAGVLPAADVPAPEPDWASRRPQPSVLLVLEDLPPGATDEARGWVQAAKERLERARFLLVGGGRDHGLGEAREIELRAEALRTLELADPRDPEAVTRLQEFVARHASEIQGVLWIGRDGDDPDQLAWQVIPARDLDGDDVRWVLDPAARVVDAPPGALVYSIH